MPKYDRDTHEFDVYKIQETDKAYLLEFDDDDKQVWVPKSICELESKSPDGVLCTVELPMWFIEENEIG